MSRTDQYAVTLSVNGVDLGIWDKFQGGEVDSEETKYKPGNMQPELSLGGTKTVTNITLQVLYDGDRFTPAICGFLDAMVGRGWCVVGRQLLDLDGAPKGVPRVYQGRLRRWALPEVDSEGNAAGLIELEISPRATVG